MLKENGKTKNKKGRQTEYIICKNCRRKINIASEEEQENITKIGMTRVYECLCGEQIIL